MSTLAFFHNDIIPRLKSLLAVMLAHAQLISQELETDFAATTAKLHPIIAAMAQLMRAITLADVYVFQQRRKANMLSDPAWRARVIAGFGGLAGLYIWERHFDAAQARGPLDALFAGEENTPRLPRKPRDPAAKTRQFRLPPISRICTGRERGEHEWGFSTKTRSPYDAPIIVTPRELRANPESQALDYPAHKNDSEVSQASAAPPTPIPP